MEDKIYRQRRNLMITCIGIILFYMGPGDFNEIGLLKNLGLHTLESYQLKTMILIMYLYYAWRYYQYSNDNKSPFIESCAHYLLKEGRHEANNVNKDVLESEIINLKNSSPKNVYSAPSTYTDVLINSLLGDWKAVYTVTVTPPPDSPRAGNYPEYRYCSFKGWSFQLKVIFKVLAQKPSFTDWVIPWLFFWGTWALIVWNEAICTAWQLASV